VGYSRGCKITNSWDVGQMLILFPEVVLQSIIAHAAFLKTRSLDNVIQEFSLA